MELYDKVSYATSRLITLSYSTSFSTSSKLFSEELRPHIYAIYGLVRIADEIVDSYRGNDVLAVLTELEAEVHTALTRRYSTNPIVHGFVHTATQFGITDTLIKPFFASMAMDIEKVEYTQNQYEQYIYGSAEVIGLMCLRVFTSDNESEYVRLEHGARALGAAYQKVNFLRDMSADYKELGRIYFPGVQFEKFSEKVKYDIIRDIEVDLVNAKKAVRELPSSSRRAVNLSVEYYSALLGKLKKTPAETIKQQRVRINNASKLLLFVRASTLGRL